MTEEEALDRVNEIGTAFDNDYNDGFGAQTLTYRAAYVEDGEDEEFEFVWQLKLVSGPG